MSMAILSHFLFHRKITMIDMITKMMIMAATMIPTIIRTFFVSSSWVGGVKSAKNKGHHHHLSTNKIHLIKSVKAD